MKMSENPKRTYLKCGMKTYATGNNDAPRITTYARGNNDAPSITKYGSPVQLDTKIVAVPPHCAKGTSCGAPDNYQAKKGTHNNTPIRALYSIRVTNQGFQKAICEGNHVAHLLYLFSLNELWTCGANFCFKKTKNQAGVSCCRKMH